jgi:ATP-dependent RNA helicase DDX54/DBP10
MLPSHHYADGKPAFPSAAGGDDKTGRRCIVFCATRHSVELLIGVLSQAGVNAEGVHGQMDQEYRSAALARFRERKTRILVVTDVAARGLDIPLLDTVVNYDFPATPKLFIHRGGRCARAGAVGTIHSLVTPEDLPYMIDCSTFLGRAVSCEPLDDGASASSSLLERSDNFLTGCLPNSRVSRHLEDLARFFESDGGLGPQAATARRGFDLYCRTRPKASGSGMSPPSRRPFLQQLVCAWKWLRPFVRVHACMLAFRCLGFRV